MEKYVITELECRKKYLPVVCILHRQPVGRVLDELHNGEVSLVVQDMLTRELGFSSWEELTQAALSAVEV